MKDEKEFGGTSLTADVAVSAVSPRPLPHVEPRVETGAVQFGADWPGVWMRGDNAAAYARLLEQIAAVLERDTSGLSGMALAGVRGLIRLLTSVRAAHPPEIAPPAPAQGTAWQDIATAPKNGTRILTPEGEAYWNRLYKRWIACGDAEAFTYSGPTHWMPLPPPPPEAD